MATITPEDVLRSMGLQSSHGTMWNEDNPPNYEIVELKPGDRRRSFKTLKKARPSLMKTHTGLRRAAHMQRSTKLGKQLLDRARDAKTLDQYFWPAQRVALARLKDLGQKAAADSGFLDLLKHINMVAVAMAKKGNNTSDVPSAAAETTSAAGASAKQPAGATVASPTAAAVSAGSVQVALPGPGAAAAATGGAAAASSMQQQAHAEASGPTVAAAPAAGPTGAAGPAASAAGQRKRPLPPSSLKPTNAERSHRPLNSRFKPRRH